MAHPKRAQRDQSSSTARRSSRQPFGIEQGSDISGLESVRWQAAADGKDVPSILGGDYLPEEQRRRCCVVVLCSVLTVLLLLLAGLAAAAGVAYYEGWQPLQDFGSSMTPSGDGESQGMPQQPPHPTASVTAPAVPAPEPPASGNPLQTPPSSRHTSAGGLSPGKSPATADATGVHPSPAQPARVTPHARWIYQLPRTWTRQDYDQTKLSTDLAYSHMAMMTQLPNGSLASLMQASTTPGEGNAGQALYWQVSRDWGETWSPPRTVLPAYYSASHTQLPYWSPVLHTQGGVTYMFFSVSVEECVFLRPTSYSTTCWTPGGDIMMVQSRDNGESWTKPQMVYAFAEGGGIPKVIANKLAITAGGDWLLPFWRENDQWDTGASCNARPDLMGVPGVLISSDKGKSWTVSKSILHGRELTHNWMIENTIAPVTLPNGKPSLLQMFRTEMGVPAYASRSSDGGHNWDIATPTTVANPNSKMHLIALPGDVLLLAYDNDPRLRTPLALAMSRDAGASWTQVVVIEQNPCGQFSYPTIQYVPANGRIYVAYTVLFLPPSMPADCQAQYSAQGGNSTLPASGMRVYMTTEALLRSEFETLLRNRTG